MLATDSPPLSTLRRLSPRAIVTLRPVGLHLVASKDRGPHELDMAALRTLEALARTEPPSLEHLIEQYGASAETLVDELLLRKLLVDPDRTPLQFDPVDRPRDAMDWDPDVPLFLVTPMLFAVTPDGFVTLDHDGKELLRIGYRGLLVLEMFIAPVSPNDAFVQYCDRFGADLIDRTQFMKRVRQYLGKGILRVDIHEGRLISAGRDKSDSLFRAALRKEWSLRAAVDVALARIDEEEAERTARTGVTRTRIVPIHNHGEMPPLGIGMVLSYAKAYEDGILDEHYSFRPDWVAATRNPEELAPEPGIFLFSNYLWSHRQSIKVSEAIKAHSPHSVTIHGGPDTPGYLEDIKTYFAANPHVDITVHGEGEVTTAEILKALTGKVGNGPVDLSVLEDVKGLSYRWGDSIVHTGSRDRLENLDVIPSPYLTGLFDSYGEVPEIAVTIETNRGCPYGCTFCDWGSNTMARIRKFDLDRVMAELEWCASHKVLGIGLADANFGIFERDVEIAQRVVELREQYDYPKACTGSYAKNTVKHLQKIISTWIDGGVLTLGVLSLQSMDEDTLKAVRRSNIKTEKYDALAGEFRRRGLPLYVDIMMGLPGSTYQSFIDDLQNCVDREVQAKIHETTLLTNSPMNDPAYRKEHQIKVRKPGPAGKADPFELTVISTSTMSEEDFEEMARIRRLFLMCENFGVLRLLARYFRQETGRREMDLYEAIQARVDQEPERWLALGYLVESAHTVMAPPISWKLLIDEIRDVLIDEGVPDDAALETALRVQHAALPAHSRVFPLVLDLPHDFSAWHDAMIERKIDGLPWTDEVPHLRDLGPGTFEVTDPYNVGETLLGGALDAAWFDGWELVSSVARPMPYTIDVGAV